MKICVKKEICGSREQCTGPIGKLKCSSLKKKKKNQNTGAEKIISIQTYNKYENQSSTMTSLVFGSLLVIRGKKKLAYFLKS